MIAELEQIKLDEGFSPVAYECPEGFLTIGYGYNLERFGAPRNIIEVVFGDVVWTEEKASAVLEETLKNVQQRLLSKFPWIEDGHPEDLVNILLNMTYQMGIHRLAKFTKTLRYCQLGLYADAAVEVMNSKFARQTPNRAERARDRFYQLSK